MAKMIINGEVCSGSSSYASAVEYIKDDGSKSTVQNEIDELNKNLDTLQCYDDNAEILIGTADGRNVYRKLVRQQLEGGFASFKLTNKPIFLIVSLDVFYAPEGQGIIVKGVLDNSTVVYQNGQMNLNLTSQTTANVICHITIEYEADE